jgi:hypothetical protein
VGARATTAARWIARRTPRYADLGRLLLRLSPRAHAAAGGEAAGTADAAMPRASDANATTLCALDATTESAGLLGIFLAAIKMVSDRCNSDRALSTTALPKEDLLLEKARQKDELLACGSEPKKRLA